MNVQGTYCMLDDIKRTITYALPIPQGMTSAETKSERCPDHSKVGGVHHYPTAITDYPLRMCACMCRECKCIRIWNGLDHHPFVPMLRSWTCVTCHLPSP